ncbi:CotH kinase family protein, partial [candidate division KSB1 bacterium]|nr:CotH kinase family protein [candidate division KSB1 bacterium]
MRTTKLLFLISIAGIVFQTMTIANPADESWKIFDDTSVGEVNILIHPPYLNFILDPAHAQSDSLFPAVLLFKNSVIPGDTLFWVGFRIRGNTSRNSAKKSFKLDFNHFVPGRKFYDLEKMNLNGEHNDPSIMRSKLCWDLFQQIRVPASRANHVRLYINDKYFGLYINVEHIDDEFVQKRFGNQNGNLYKCLYPADLVYLGADQQPYKKFFGDRQAYELMTNKDKNDYSDLVHFIDVLNNT